MAQVLSLSGNCVSGESYFSLNETFKRSKISFLEFTDDILDSNSEKSFIREVVVNDFLGSLNSDGEEELKKELSLIGGACPEFLSYFHNYSLLSGQRGFTPIETILDCKVTPSKNFINFSEQYGLERALYVNNLAETLNVDDLSRKAMGYFSALNLNDINRKYIRINFTRRNKTELVYMPSISSQLNSLKSELPNNTILPCTDRKRFLTKIYNDVKKNSNNFGDLNFYFIFKKNPEDTTLPPSDLVEDLIRLVA